MAIAEQSLVTMRLKRRQQQEAQAKAPAFAEVYRRHFRPLYAFVAYRVCDRTAAEDITSQVFEKALKAFPGYDSRRGTVSTWLYAIARNAISDHFRSQGRHSHTGLDEHTTVSGDGDPQAELHASEMRRELAAALADLEIREHEVLALKFGAGLTNRRIADLLEISESNAGTILYRSLKKLKTELEGVNAND
ncbi:RNA polymerase sigma factor SigX [bacterium BMS3Abin01]|nr:RNA polymerase sigma factor SigX [bacterium BMS3Abin01]HDZ59294.1 sigma-70 family RNA polymerase sigma factor [Actinomycetota bacterium]